MTTLLVANRGEIALRVFRTAERMGMRTVAVHSDADAAAPHVRAAHAAVRIGPAAAPESYLRIDRIVEAALQTGADLVHPGYGFLAEDAAFARACEQAGLVFVGPSSEVLARAGDKIAVRRIAAEAGVPLLDAYDGDDQSDAAFERAARDIGCPVVVKPAGGGGGKGMTVVRDPTELTAALASSRRIAAAAFSDERLILERYLDAPRHVEVQVMADTHGHTIHLGERDCSLQRRHQKLFEETPAPNLGPRARDRLCEAATALAVRAGYVGAGTCEFLVQDETFGFIEMNARLQVEHPVTEAVTGLDLVELQLRVALGEELPLAQGDVRPRGHSVEVRVYAEDPEHDFLPQAGRIEHVRWPERSRVDAGIEEGTEVSTHYDPLLAKLVVSGRDRDTALDALRVALADTEVLGPHTNLSFLRAVCDDDVVKQGGITTRLVEDAYRDWRRDRSDAPRAVRVAAAAEAARIARAGRTAHDPWTSLGPWRAGSEGATLVVLRWQDEEVAVPVGRDAPRRAGDCHGWTADATRAAAVKRDGTWLVWYGDQYEIDIGPAPRRLAEAGAARLDSPLPGQVVAVRVEPGERVGAGQELVVVEAMKMEHAIRAPADGTVTAVLCAPGDRVDRGQELARFEPG